MPRTAGELLAENTREGALGALYKKLGGKRVQCFACAHRCAIPDGRDGICKVRFNSGGILKVPWGYASAVQCDPIEKKPFFHVMPGSLAMSFGMLGCCLHCSFCQNWVSSQALRDDEAMTDIYSITPEKFVGLAVAQGAKIVSSTYNEPLITSEWAVDIFKLAGKKGLKCSYVSNGNATPEVLDYLRPHMDLFKVDLKCFSDRNYRLLGMPIKNVLDGIEWIHRRKFWMEIVTLVIPGFNDSDAELRDMAKFISGISKDIPWHVTAFHADYRMTGRDSTPVPTLLRAAEAGAAEGLRFVYAGNLPGRTKNFEDTRCPGCGETLIARRGFYVEKDMVSSNGGVCPGCGAAIPGVWK